MRSLFKGGDKDGTFSVREEHGEIILMKQLNPQRMAYELTVQAADNAAPRNIDMAKVSFIHCHGDDLKSFPSVLTSGTGTI